MGGDTQLKEGLFQHTCLGYEVVTANGEVLWCDKDNNPDIFHCIPMSCGTLGFVVLAKIRIIKCTTHIAMTYLPFTKLDEAIDFYKETSLK